MTDFTKKTDEELCQLSLENQAAFYELMKRYENKFLSYILRLGQFSKEDAEDILQEVYIKIYTNLNAFNKDLKFSSWGYRIAHNEVISQFRKNKNKFLVHLEDEDWQNLRQEFDLDKEITKKIDNEIIAKILEKMDIKYKEVLILKFLEDKSYEEISDILKKPMGTIATLINRAKKQFKKIYKQSELSKDNRF